MTSWPSPDGAGPGTASGKSAIYRVSAWAAANPISLGHMVTDAKSSETIARISIKNKRLTTG